MQTPRRLLAALARLLPSRRRPTPITDAAGLGRFLQTRSAHVAQTSLYGYLRARAGTRFPELFSNDEFVNSINIAKWHVWLGCVSDLAVYAGGMLCRAGTARADAVAALLQSVVAGVLRETGVPADAGPEFAAHAERVRARLALCDLGAIPDDETAFAESPLALVHWAPIVDELKQLDEEIVRNSIRFRWQEVRRELRRDLDARALLAHGATLES
jgi:hypothetical protein